jgi:hypothetical protein
VLKGGGLTVEHSGGVRGVVTWYLRRIDDEVVVAIACSYTPKGNLQQLAHDLGRIAAKG